MNFNGFNRLITIKHDVGTEKTPGGEHIESWETYCQVWGKEISATGSEGYQSAELIGVTIKKWKCRYSAGIKQNMLATVDNVDYDITEIVELGFKEGLQITGFKRDR